jgi:hypothetical protein
MLEAVVEILFELVAEVLLQVVFEALAEAGVHVARNPTKDPPRPWLAAIGYAGLGAIAGGISVWLVPALFMTSQKAQLLNLLVAPVFAVLVMMAIGSWRRSRGQELIRLDRFAYGWLFAFAMALVRYVFGGA